MQSSSQITTNKPTPSFFTARFTAVAAAVLSAPSSSLVFVFVQQVY